MMSSVPASIQTETGSNKNKQSVQIDGGVEHVHHSLNTPALNSGLLDMCKLCGA